jgi:2-polyprenyl-3-methyl-5-hydroxy-6-metoxy-1,4-benzoquinol methylase
VTAAFAPDGAPAPKAASAPDGAPAPKAASAPDGARAPQTGVTADVQRFDHYSYAVYADPAMAERFDAMRFGGPIGRLIADTQEQQIAAFLGSLERQRILDVGTGTGRAAIALARRGAVVTGVDASAEMLQVAGRRARDAGASVMFARGDAHCLDFADRSFDAVVCLRVLMHTPDWQRSLKELCRVANQRLVFDYPARWSTAALQAGARRLAHVFAPRVEAYRVFSSRAIARALDAEGFRITGEHRQFVLPIALHKRVGSEAWTKRTEAWLTRAGLMRRFGSPVTVVAERCAS